jgi:DNA polymerase-3 subunit gamma/tau
MLTRAAWHALLKILEEPPPRVVFVFATTEPQKIAQAAAPVLSRLQRFDFKRIGPAEIRDRLARVLADEGITAEPEALAAIARAADGSMRDGLSLTDQVLAMGDGRITAERVRESLGLIPEDEFIALLDVIAQRRAADVFGVVARLAEAGIDFGGFLGGLGDILRAQLAVVLGGRAADASERMRVALDERKDNFTAADLLRMLAALSELEPRFRKSAQQQLLIETLLVRFALLDRSVELEQVLQTLGGTRGPVAEGRGSGASGDKGSSGARGSGNPRTLGDAVAPSAPPMRADRQEPPNDPPIRGGAPSRPEARATHAPMAFAAPAVASLPAATPFAAPSPRPVAAPTPPSSGDLPALDLNRVTGRWDELVEHLKADGKPLILIAALKHARPVAVTARGDVAIELDEPNDIYDRAVSDGCPDVRVVLRSWFAGVERVFLRRDERAGAAPPPKRLTNEMVRAERLASLRKRDPLLEAAIDALDLDVAD